MALLQRKIYGPWLGLDFEEYHESKGKNALITQKYKKGKSGEEGELPCARRYSLEINDPGERRFPIGSRIEPELPSTRPKILPNVSDLSALKV